MIERSYDASLMHDAITACPAGNNEDIDCDAWLKDDRNVMFVDDGNIGLATYEYPGLWTLHWFFVARGREALNMAKAMMDKFFHDYPCKAIRGMTPVDIRGARWLARQLGLTSQGIMETTTGEVEVFTMTKEDFYRKYD